MTLADLSLAAPDGVVVRYEVHGDPSAPPVVLVHGLGGDRRMWSPQIASLPAAGYFVVVPDLRGHGASDPAPSFRLADCARDIVGILDDLGIPRAHLVGVSMGGTVVQQLTTDVPDRVRSQILVDSLSGISRPAERFNAAVAALLLRVLSRRVQALLVRRAYAGRGHCEVGEYLAERLLASDPRSLRAARLAVNRFDVLDDLPAVRVPTLVLVGDTFGELAVGMARTTAERIPGARLQILPGGGDPSNLLVPESFDAALLAFLAKE
ncbi:MAG: 3-oxoadipate enol-lactonase [Actinomycetota bacterium]|nr:3-oxoadipate enol-lactonase [Actinomycetota bacterium]